MIEFNLIYFLLFFTIITLQTIVGVGILVLGTPLLLILQHGIIDTISILLPISILTSLINIIFFKTINKKNKIKLDKKINNFFFTLCLPAVFFGIFILKIFHELINFQILVSVIILATLVVKVYYRNTVLNFSNLKKKTILFFIGLIHGITNSGGTILSLFVLSLNKNLKNQTRYSLTFFYFFLALFQYFIFIVAFKKILSFDLMIFLILIVLAGCLCGNFLVKFIKETFFQNLIELLAFLSAMFLIANNLYF